MPQHFIVDGYNLMKSDPELEMFQRFGLEFAREAVIKRVNNAAGLRTASSITIVFDGHLNGQPVETRQRQGRIHVIYSKLGENADSVIKRLVAGYTQTNEVKVITRDWELKDAARAANQTSGTMKRRASLNQTRQTRFDKDEQDDRPGWNHTTKKKGSAKRTPKNTRKKGPGDDVYW